MGGEQSLEERVRKEIYDRVYTAARHEWDWMPPAPKRSWTADKLIETFRQPIQWEHAADLEEEEVLAAVFYLITLSPFPDGTPEWILGVGNRYQRVAPSSFVRLREWWKEGRGYQALTVRAELYYRAIVWSFTEWKRGKSVEVTSQMENDVAHKLGNVEADHVDAVIEEQEALSEVSLEWDVYDDEQTDLLRHWMQHRGLPSGPDELERIARFYVLGEGKYALRDRRTLYTGIGHFAVEGERQMGYYL